MTVCSLFPQLGGVIQPNPCRVRKIEEDSQPVHCHLASAGLPNTGHHDHGEVGKQSWAPIIGKLLDESTMSVPALIF